MPDDFGPVTPDNQPRAPRRVRRDPDAIPDPNRAETPPAPPAPATGNGIARRDDDARGGGGLLADMLASKQPRPGEGAPPPPGPQLTLDDLIRLRARPTDPFTDYVGDGTRQLSWIQDTVAFIAEHTGRTRQEVYRDALLGVEPLNPDLLDRHFYTRYGYPRPRQHP